MSVDHDDFFVTLPANPLVSTTLPVDIRTALLRADVTPVSCDPLARVRAIEAVTQRARLLRSDLFQEVPLWAKD